MNTLKTIALALVVVPSTMMVANGTLQEAARARTAEAERGSSRRMQVAQAVEVATPVAQPADVAVDNFDMDVELMEHVRSQQELHENNMTKLAKNEAVSAQPGFFARQMNRVKGFGSALKASGSKALTWANENNTNRLKTAGIIVGLYGLYRAGKYVYNNGRKYLPTRVKNVLKVVGLMSKRTKTARKSTKKKAARA
ncbi:MAG TPA: hypothetical protein VLG71_00990 [Candidatus Limnocylindria bacterium]|nr:hypothetical protein [Candidatus Limnocylindria bacterium]